MTAPTEAAIAYSYATFLVKLFPEDAIEILCQGSSGENTTLVEKRVDFNCSKFRGYSKNKIKGMAENHEWDDLRALMPSSPQVSMTPRAYNRADTGQAPPTPSSTASGSPQSHRQRSPDWITIYPLTSEPCRLTAISSGSEEYMIGEDKLERLPGVTVEWIDHRQQIEVGGNWISVAQRVPLTWNRLGDGGTKYSYFWVVSPEYIRHADVLLGYKGPNPRDLRDKGVVRSPLALDPQDTWNTKPPAPTAPPAVHPELYQRQSSTAMYSTGHSPHHSFGRAPTQSSSRTTVHHAPETSVRTDPSVSGSRPFHNTFSSMPPPSSMDRPPSRPQSAASSKTTKSCGMEAVLIQLSFEGKGKRLVFLDLAKTGDEFIPWLEPHVRKMPGGKRFDRNNYELKVTPFHKGEEDATSTPLSESSLDHCWESVIDFMRENRADGGSKKPEFCFDVESE
ncbi:hypothetical protein BKA65DRAFT_207065 [Rhexocercosporidium sp. MPI-PUGE-AT-0058]|nr:hypothetical protein BKA65DRAFT_207065 [Rhexocercosporidium sp. MPI-PUGE-AT-0058]